MILGEGAELQPGLACPRVRRNCNRCRLGQVSSALSHCHSVALHCHPVALSHCQVSLAGSPLSRYGGAKYENLYIGALREYGMLCLGLYRYLDLSDNPSAATARKIHKTMITRLM